MKASVYFLLSVFFIGVLSACGDSNPYVNYEHLQEVAVPIEQATQTPRQNFLRNPFAITTNLTSKFVKEATTLKFEIRLKVLESKNEPTGYFKDLDFGLQIESSLAHSELSNAKLKLVEELEQERVYEFTWTVPKIAQMNGKSDLQLNIPLLITHDTHSEVGKEIAVYLTGDSLRYKEAILIQR